MVDCCTYKHDRHDSASHWGYDQHDDVYSWSVNSMGKTTPHVDEQFHAPNCHNRYCRAGFDSDGLIAAKIATKIIAIIGFRYRKYTHYTLYGSCPPIYGIAIIRSLLFLFLAHFHESANICVAIKSDSTVYLHLLWQMGHCRDYSGSS